MAGGRIYAEKPASSLPAAFAHPGSPFASPAPERGMPAAREQTGRAAPVPHDARVIGERTRPSDAPVFDLTKVRWSSTAGAPSRSGPSGAALGASVSGPPLRVQAKLEVGAVDDPLEREADRVADRVMRMPDASPTDTRDGAAGGASARASRADVALQRKCATCGDDKVQRKCSTCEDEEKVRRSAVGSAPGAVSAPAVVHDVLRSTGQPLDAGTRAFMEPRFGSDFSAVRVHVGASADASARAMSATAYAVGRHVVFRDGAFAPTTSEGRRLLAHELAHVVQQGHGASPSDADPAAETDAVRVGRGIGRRVQRDGESAAALDDEYRTALQMGDWQAAAEWLNGFNQHDIFARLDQLSSAGVAALHQGAIANPRVGPDSQVALLTDPSRTSSSRPAAQGTPSAVKRGNPPPASARQSPAARASLSQMCGGLPVSAAPDLTNATQLEFERGPISLGELKLAAGAVFVPTGLGTGGYAPPAGLLANQALGSAGTSAGGAEALAPVATEAVAPAVAAETTTAEALAAAAEGLTAAEVGGGAEVEAATGPVGWIVGGVVVLTIGALLVGAWLLSDDTPRQETDVAPRPHTDVDEVPRTEQQKCFEFNPHALLCEEMSLDVDTFVRSFLAAQGVAGDFNCTEFGDPFGPGVIDACDGAPGIRYHCPVSKVILVAGKKLRQKLGVVSVFACLCCALDGSTSYSYRAHWSTNLSRR